QLYIRIAFFGISKAETLPRPSLIVKQIAYVRVRQRSMRDNQLTGRKAAWISGINFGCVTKKSNLEADRLLLRTFQPARYIPPFRAKARMRPNIRRKAQRYFGDNRGKLEGFGK